MYHIPVNVAESDFKTVRILVSGDSSVGKTSLLHFICTGEVLEYPKATIGCDIKVKEVGPKPYSRRFIEFWEVGGHPSFNLSRNLFYQNTKFDGVVLVHDLSKAGLNSIDQWLAELEQSLGGPSSQPDTLSQTNSQKDDSAVEADLEVADCGALPLVGGSIPLLVLGNKLDLADKKKLTAWEQRAARASYTMLAVSATTGFVESRQIMFFFDKVFEQSTGHSVESGGRRTWKDLWEPEVQSDQCYTKPDLRRRITDDNFSPNKKGY